MRCITLGDALRRAGMSVELSSQSLPNALDDRARSFGISMRYRDLGISEGALAEQIAATASFAVIDSYEASAEFYGAMLELRVPHLVIDDNRETPFARPTAVLNQNLHANEGMYRDLDESVTLLLGAPWALIRPEVVWWRDAPRAADRSIVVVALGGADLLGLSPAIEAALCDLGIDAQVASGLVVGTKDALDGLADPEKLAAALAACSVAVVGAGTTLWETACLGTPTIGLVVADNQADLAKAAADAGMAQVFEGRYGADPVALAAAVQELLLDAARRAAMRSSGQSLVDGRGAARVAKQIRALIDGVS